MLAQSAGMSGQRRSGGPRAVNLLVRVKEGKMKYRTFLKREGRFWRLDALQQKRCQWLYRIVRVDESVSYSPTTTKMLREWLHARRLYYAAYAVFGEKRADKRKLVRASLCKLGDAAKARAIPPGRHCDLFVTEKGAKR